MKLKRIRKKLNKEINKNGTISNRAIEAGKIIDQITVEEMQESYRQKEWSLFERSMKALQYVTVQLEKFPTVEEWNRFAMENGMYSSLSLEYMSQMNWNKIRTNIYKEINHSVKQAKQKKKDNQENTQKKGNKKM